MAGPSVLITGAAGFIGGALLRRLAGAMKVTGLDRAEVEPMAGADWIAGGFDAASLPAARLEGVSTVVHAAWTGYPGTPPGMHAALDRNIADTLDLYLRCRAAGVGRFVFPSSGGTVYGEPALLPIGEETPLRPISLYGAAKGATELFLHGLAQAGGPRPVVLRIANPFGPGQLPWRGQGVIPTAIACALTGKPFTQWGEGAAERDYLFIDDLVDALAAVVREEGPTGTFNIGSGTGVSLDACLDTIEAVVGRPLARIPAGGRGVDVAHNVLDATRFRATYGWSPRTAFSDGVARHRDWLLASRLRWPRDAEG